MQDGEKLDPYLRYTLHEKAVSGKQYAVAPGRLNSESLPLTAYSLQLTIPLAH